MGIIKRAHFVVKTIGRFLRTILIADRKYSNKIRVL